MQNAHDFIFNFQIFMFNRDAWQSKQHSEYLKALAYQEKNSNHQQLN